MAPVKRHGTRKRLSRLVWLVVGWCALTAHVFSGCRGLFTPAVPEPPSGRPIVVDYRSPEATLATMEAGITGKGQGSAAWVGAFADSTQPSEGPGYHHVFDSADGAAFLAVCGCPGLPDWASRLQEQGFFQALLEVRPSDDYVALFDPDETQPDPPPGDSEVRQRRHYQVLATAPDGNSTLVIAIGYADLTFTKIASDWLVTRWEDHVDPKADATDPYQITLGRRRLESTR